MKNNTRRLCAVFSALMLIISLLSFTGCSEDNVNIFLDGKEISFENSPFIDGDCVFAPAEETLTAIGTDYSYDDGTGKIGAKVKGDVCSLEVGKKDFLINRRAYTLDVPVLSVRNKPYIPIKQLLELIGFNVESGGGDNVYISTADTKLEVRFIDVGQADAALLLCGGRSMLIDGGNVGDSSKIYSILNYYDIDYIDCVVCTHAHEDHVGGLSAALAKADAGVVYAPKTSIDTKSYNNFIDKVESRKLSVTHPVAGDSFYLGSAVVTFLGPVDEAGADINNTSIVLKVEFGDTSFLFTGDAESKEEGDILSTGADVRADVLKVGHHGSSSSTSYVFLREVMPKYAVISCEKGNDYGHPHEETLSRLRDAEVKVFRTDLQGDITAISDGKNIEFSTFKNEVAETDGKVNGGSKENVTVSGDSGGNVSDKEISDVPSSGAYIGNKNTKVLHSASCKSLPKEENRIYFDSYDEGINAGFKPHKNCIGG